MTASDLTALQNRILSQVPLCPAAFVTAYIRQAATQFFRESEVWRYTSEDIHLVASTAAYKIALPVAMATGVDVWRIDYAKDQGAVVTADTYDLDYRNTVVVTPPSDTWDYWMVYKTDYVPTASVADALDITVVLAPTIVGGYVTPLAWNRWSEAVFWGTKVMIYSARTRPWYDAASAADARDGYGAQLALARRERTQQFAYDGDLRMTNPEGWR